MALAMFAGTVRKMQQAFRTTVRANHVDGRERRGSAGGAVSLSRFTVFTRRRTSYLLAVGVVISAVGAVRPVATQFRSAVAPAMRFVKQAGDKLLAVLNGPDDRADKRRKIEVLVDATIDTGGIARFALGRFWRSATEAQRDEYLHLFPGVLVDNLNVIIGPYPGVTFTVDRGVQRDDDVEVWTTVFLPGTAPRGVGWIVGTADGTTAITDIIAEGTSLRIAQRDAIAGFLAEHNHDIAALIDMLRQGVGED
jgi:phospholipid transport system substrate-binding protein